STGVAARSRAVRGAGGFAAKSSDPVSIPTSLPRAWNKATAAAVSMGVEAASPPTDGNGDQRWSPDPRSRADRLELTLASTLASEVRSENLIDCRHNTGAGGCRTTLPGNGARAETLGREHLARHLPACRYRLSERRNDNPALRAPVRILPPCSMEGP